MTSDNLSDLFPVKVGARSFPVDLQRYTRRPLDSIRAAVDQSARPGDQSLSNEGLWRNSGRSFDHGTGQGWFDEEDSDPERSYSSAHLDLWTARQATLLPTTEEKRSSANTNLRVLATSSRLWIVDGQVVAYTADPTVATPTFTSVTGLPAASPVGVTTDGTYVYIGYSANGVYRVSTSGSAASSWSATNVAGLQVANGRLMAWSGANIFELDGSGTKADLWSHTFGASWSAVVGAPNAIYAACNAGADSWVYMISIIDADGSLAAPTWATDMIGLNIHSLAWSSNVVILGTSRGIGLALITGSGYLAPAPQVDLGTPVYCIEAQRQYAWFGWTNFSATRTGLGRLRLDEFVDVYVPGYASDLMAPASTQATVLDVETFGQKRYFALSGEGFYGETTTKEASGELVTGKMTWATGERKNLVGVELAFDQLPSGASLAVTVATEDDSDEVLTASTLLSTKARAEVALQAEEAQLTITLTKGSSSDGPTLRRWTLFAMPTPFKAEEVFLPVVLKRLVTDQQLTRQAVLRDPWDDWSFLRGLEASRKVVDVSIGKERLRAVVDGIALDPGMADNWTSDHQFVEGVWYVKLITQPDFTT